jgi:SSS family transporter
MAKLDWIILVIYIAGIIGLSAWIGKRQKSQEDYYLGGRRMAAWQIALSVMATQVSAISLIGAPAFIALQSGGGLVWLQYEFAIPLAMIGIMLILIPVYHRAHGITIYEYLEIRFGAATRQMISAVFLISRGLGSGVALLATAIVTAVCLNWDLPETILLIGVVAIIYTTFGGIVADIYSDIIQLIILWGGAIITLIILATNLSPADYTVLYERPERMRVFDFSQTGLGDGATFAFWPMLIGGLFLYLSYYGCDQSQAQRLLTTETPQQARKAMLYNALGRFPLVLTYSAVGVLLIPFLATHPEFAARLDGQKADFLVPYFLLDYMPTGLLGLLIAGFFAASMSSIDSALNSLSAASYRDFLIKWFPALNDRPPQTEVRISRLLTIFWGIVATGFALEMVGGSETVLELVNKIGSAFYGPVLAVFITGIFARRVGESAVIAGLLAGVLFNIYLWQVHAPAISWMWWNVAGFLVTLCLALLLPTKRTGSETTPVTVDRSAKIMYLLLLLLFFLLLLTGWLIERILSA